MTRTSVPAGRHQRRIGLSILALAAAAAMAVAACSSTASSIADRPAREAATAAPSAAAAAAPQPPGKPQQADGPTGTTSGGSGSGEVAAITTGPLIIRTGSLAIEVVDLDRTLLATRGRIVGLGGYVSDSERSNSGDRATALITYRIPAARWDEAMDALRGAASKVLAEDTKAADVTGEVLDLGARIDNLRATEKALQAIMTQATKIQDILDVQNQLTTVQGQIEQLTTQQAHLNDQAAMGTLAVTYTLPVIAVAQATTGWNLAAEVDRAVALLVQVGQGLAVIAVWLAVVGLPVLVGFGIVVGLALFAVRRFGPRREHVSPAA